MDLDADGSGDDSMAPRDDYSRQEEEAPGRPNLLLQRLQQREADAPRLLAEESLLRPSYNEMEQYMLDHPELPLPLNWQDEAKAMSDAQHCAELKLILDREEVAGFGYPYLGALAYLNSFLMLCLGRVYEKFLDLTQCPAQHNHGEAMVDWARRMTSGDHVGAGQLGFCDLRSTPIAEFLRDRFTMQPKVEVPDPEGDEAADAAPAFFANGNPRKRKAKKYRGILTVWAESVHANSTSQITTAFCDRARWLGTGLSRIEQLRSNDLHFSLFRGLRVWHRFPTLAAQKQRYGHDCEVVWALHHPLRRLLLHLNYVLCGGQSNMARAVICILANIVQRPGDRIEKIIQFLGPQGSGKSLFSSPPTQRS